MALQLRLRSRRRQAQGSFRDGPLSQRVDDDTIRALATRWDDAFLSSAPDSRNAAEAALERVLSHDGHRLTSVEWVRGPFGLCDRIEHAREPEDYVLTSAWDLSAWLRLHRYVTASGGTVLFDRCSPLQAARVRGALVELLRGRYGARWQELRYAIWDYDQIPGYGDLPTELPALGWQMTWCPFWEALLERLPRNFENQARKLHALLELASLVSFWVITREPDGCHACLVGRPAVVHRDERGRLHAPSGPALAWTDGAALYALRGLILPRELIEEPLTLRRVLGEPNLERRRVLLEHYGYERLLSESGAKPQSEDEHGRLWLLELAGDEPLALLEFADSTSEPDGTHRRYFVRVPPTMRRPRQALAWTFSLSEREYALTEQS